MKKSLKSILSVSIAISTVMTGRAQNASWQQSSEWTLYNIKGAKFYKIKPDSLDTYYHRLLNDDSIRGFLSDAKPITSDKPPMWMGACVASCLINGKRHKIDISSYGGFFFDETERKYYTVAEGVRRDWLNYFAESAGSIPFKR